MERLQKIIAASGIASRRAAEELILSGKVRVNGKVLRDLGTKADPATDIISVNNKPLPKVATVTYAVHKPKGVICSRERQGNGRLVTELVPTYPKVYPVGRLDKDSEGLILLTNDGGLAQRLTHPSFGHTKQYYVIAKWQKDAEPRPLDWIEAQLTKGVRLGDGKAMADTITAKQMQHGALSLQINVHEGRNHLIRRMCAAIGLDVTLLRRTKFATLNLGTLKPGHFRTLTASELHSLHADAT